MADQVREAFEEWAAHDERLRLTTRESNGHRIYADERTLAAWGAWQAATASHAADVEALRSALRAVLAVVEDPKNYRIWAADLLTCCYTAPAFDAARAALKGDKP